jgi:predicted aspartyl protease
MGIFYIDCEIESIRPPGQKVTVPKLLVDSGSEHTWIPETELRKIGVQVAKQDCPFLMANGQPITRSIGYAFLRAGGFETVDEVVLGQPGDLALLGSRTLEGFGAVVDPQRKKLVAAGPYPVARVSRPVARLSRL